MYIIQTVQIIHSNNLTTYRTTKKDELSSLNKHRSANELLQRNLLFFVLIIIHLLIKKFEPGLFVNMFIKTFRFIFCCTIHKCTKIAELHFFSLILI